MKKIYIAGKISGLTPEQFHQKFDLAKKLVQVKNPDSEVIIPTDLCEDYWGWEKCMDTCINALWECDCVYMMPDWEDSKGSFIEKKIAEKLGLEVCFL